MLIGHVGHVVGDKHVGHDEHVGHVVGDKHVGHDEHVGHDAQVGYNKLLDIELFDIEPFDNESLDIELLEFIVYEGILDELENDIYYIVVDFIFKNCL